MKGADIKRFRFENKLTQSELGDYLDVKKSFISLMENGKCRVPASVSTKLLNNDKGWDTGCLHVSVPYHITNTVKNTITNGSNNVTTYKWDQNGGSTTKESLQALIDMLREQLRMMEASLEREKEHNANLSATCTHQQQTIDALIKQITQK